MVIKFCILVKSMSIKFKLGIENPNGDLHSHVFNAVRDGRMLLVSGDKNKKGNLLVNFNKTEEVGDALPELSKVISETIYGSSDFSDMVNNYYFSDPSRDNLVVYNDSGIALGLTQLKQYISNDNAILEVTITAFRKTARGGMFNIMNGFIHSIANVLHGTKNKFLVLKTRSPILIKVLLDLDFYNPCFCDRDSSLDKIAKNFYVDRGFRIGDNLVVDLSGTHYSSLPKPKMEAIGREPIDWFKNSLGNNFTACFIKKITADDSHLKKLISA